jgi:hypothetical protein
MSDFLELEILDHVFGAAAYTAPATISFGLWTATLSDTSTGATAGEPSGFGYDRVDVTNNATNFPAAAAGAKSNGTAITGWSNTAGGNWGDITHAAATDNPTPGSGNILAWFDLTVPKTINEGDTADFAISAFSVTLT